MTVVASFEIAFTRCLDRDGKPTGSLPGFAEDAAVLVRLYRAMALTRVFDQRAVALQRTGQLGTYASSLGQEAVGVGVASAMRADDVLVPSFREHGAQLWRGVTLLELPARLGRRRARQRFRRARARISRAPSPWAATCRTRPAWRWRSSCGASRASPSDVRRRRHLQGRFLRRRSTWPASGAYPACSSR